MSSAASSVPAAARTAVAAIDPIADPRWRALLSWHPQAGAFHSPEWLEALRRAYGFEPLAFTTAAAGEPLTDGVVFCRVRSWLTGTRLVSLPFADHCQPLLPMAPAAAASAWGALLAAAERHKGRYLELRPTTELPRSAPLPVASRYILHRVDISPPPEVLLRRFDDSCVRRRIRHAEKLALDVTAGNSPELLQDFFRLHATTRRRLGLPPQPQAWFEHLGKCFGSALTVYVARERARAVAAIVTLLFRDTLTYKYGASDAARHHLGAVPLLFWRALQAGRQKGARVFDLGRSDANTPGLIAFKDRWAASRSELVYYRSSVRRPLRPRRAKQWAQAALRQLPEACLIAAGRLGYRHVA